MHHESSPILSSKNLHFRPFKIKDVHPFHLLEDILHNLSIDLGFVVTSHKWPLSQLVDVLAASSLGKSDSLYRPKCFYSVFLTGSLALWISTYPLKNLSSWGVAAVAGHLEKACIFQRWWKHVAKFPLMKCEPLRSQAPNTGLVLLLFLFSTCPSSGQGQLRSHHACTVSALGQCFTHFIVHTSHLGPFNTDCDSFGLGSALRLSLVVGH